MNTQDIINKIAKLKDAIEGETDPEVKSRFASKIAALEADLNKAEEKVEVKIEKQQVAEQKDLTEAEKKIAKLIDEYILKRKDETLTSIFHYIHFWGGITGRNIYNKNGGFNNNFNLETYKKIVEKIIVLKKDTLYTELKIIEKLFTSIPELGISFSTKHLKFWSLYANQDNIQLPVLDSVLTIRLLHKCTPTWKDYNNYLKHMNEESLKKDTTISILERQLYNHFNQNK